jgi:hypothetical protein
MRSDNRSSATTRVTEMLFDDAEGEGEDEERRVIWRREAVEATKHTTAGTGDGLQTT